MKLLIFIILVLSVSAKIEYETGRDDSIKWRDNHFLMTNSDVGRSLDIDVSFSHTFSTIPQVVIAISALDLELGTPQGYKLSLVSVKTDGFTYRVTAYTDKWVGTVRVEWAAILDSNLRVNYNYEVSTLDLKNANIGDYNEQGFNIVYDTPLDCPNGAVASIFILGGLVNEGNFEQALSVFDITNENLSAMAMAQGSLQEHISFVTVASCAGNMESWYYGESVHDQVHIWNTQQGAARLVQYEQMLNYPEFLNTGLDFYGLSSYDAESSSTNVRIKARRIKLQDDGQGNIFASQQIGTWSDSVTDAIYVDAFSYNVRNQCAVLYDQCEYQGESIEVCSGEPVNALELTAWGDRDVMSVTVPKGRTLTLFDKQNLQGPYTQVREDVQCSAGWTFT